MSWDDGSHAKVKKVELTFDDVIYSIQVTYEGALQSTLHGSVGPKSDGFTLPSDEYLTSFSAYAKTLASQEAITAVTFTTNKGTNYGPYGKKTNSQITDPGQIGKHISGFYGTSGNILNSINAHYSPAPVPTTTPKPTPETESGLGVQKVDAQGGTGGAAWDDGSSHDGVTNVTVRCGGEGIQYVQFDYVQGGQPKKGSVHGVHGSKGSTPKLFSINHPDEYVISVEGWYDSSNIVQGIQFKTNKKNSDYFGYDFDDGTKFTLQVQGKKIIGFFGSASDHLNSIGAYFVPITSSTTPQPSLGSKKLTAKGGETGVAWDDGAYENVKKVYVAQGTDGVQAVKFEYTNGSEVVLAEHVGEQTRVFFDDPFELESDEYITIVEGTHERTYGHESVLGLSDIVIMLKFTTNKRTSIPYGMESGTPFELKEEGHKITGFHGRAGEYLNAIGVYLAPVGTTPLGPAKPAN